MAPAPVADGARSGRTTPIVLLLLLSVAAAAYYAVVPDYYRVRDGVRVELAARAAQQWDAAARSYVKNGWTESVTNVTREMVDDYSAPLDEPPVEWPEAADLASLDASDTNGVSVAVLLRDGPRRVSAADLVRPAAKP